MLNQKSNRYAIKAGLLFDGISKEPLEDAYVTVENDKIENVSTEQPSSPIIYDASNYTVMPGLIDAHLHLTGWLTDRMVEETVIRQPELLLLKAAKDIEQLLESGFTTVRDMSSLNGVPLRTAMQQGYVRGPRILTTHRALSQTFGHGDEHYFPLQIVKERSKFKFGFGDLICDGVDECIRGARSTLREGADSIKIFTTGGVMSERDKPEDEQFTIEEITAIVNEARKVRTYVASHAQGTQGIKNALIGGVRTIEHGIFLDEEGAKMMKANDTILTPTLSIVHQIVKEGREAGTPEWGLEKAQKVVDIHVKNLVIAKKYGVKIAAGTDFTGTPMLKYGLNAMELQLLVEKCDFTPLEAIIAATKNAAEACNLLHKTGTLEGGKSADLIAVKGNPLEDIKTIQDRDNIKFVIKDGRIEVNKGLKNNS